MSCLAHASDTPPEPRGLRPVRFDVRVGVRRSARTDRVLQRRALALLRLFASLLQTLSLRLELLGLLLERPLASLSLHLLVGPFLFLDHPQVAHQQGP